MPAKIRTKARGIPRNPSSQAERVAHLVLPGANRHDPSASCTSGLGLARVVTLSLCCRRAHTGARKTVSLCLMCWL